MRSAISRQRAGFTIVELLVVIVVIGILASITIVSYTGINQKAVVASLKLDMSNAANQLKIFNLEKGVFPTTISNDCAAQPDTPTNKCLRPSSGNEFDEDGYSSPSPHQTFTLRAKHDTIVFVITESSPPSEVAPLTVIAVASGTAQAGSVLAAGALTPSGATATYQWQSSMAVGGTYANVSGATGITYTPVSDDIGKYLRVIATGSGSYWGSVTSSATYVVAPSLIFATGGTITSSGGYRTHTFGPGTYSLTTSISGTITVIINGAGGGGGGGAPECGSAGPGLPGVDSYITYSGGSWIAEGGGGGGGTTDSCDSANGGLAGANGASAIQGSATMTGWNSINGAGGGGGSGGVGDYITGGKGGNGGKMTGSLSLLSGKLVTIFVSSGGAGSPGANDGNPGSATISYSY